MKTLSIIFFSLLFSCETSETQNEFTLEGSWEITERATFSILDNKVIWKELPENERYLITFEDSNNVRATNRDCVGSYFLNEAEKLTLSIEFECTDENLLYSVTANQFENGELIFDDISENAPDEGLALKLKKI
ncbi:MAG: hypothetical protein WBG48_14435 [Pricia sp.]